MCIYIYIIITFFQTNLVDSETQTKTKFHIQNIIETKVPLVNPIHHSLVEIYLGDVIPEKKFFLNEKKIPDTIYSN